MRNVPASRNCTVAYSQTTHNHNNICDDITNNNNNNNYQYIFLDLLRILFPAMGQKHSPIYHQLWAPLTPKWAFKALQPSLRSGLWRLLVSEGKSGKLRPLLFLFKHQTHNVFQRWTQLFRSIKAQSNRCHAKKSFKINILDLVKIVKTSLLLPSHTTSPPLTLTSSN